MLPVNFMLCVKVRQNLFTNSVLILKSWRINKAAQFASVELLLRIQLTYQDLIFLNPVQSLNIFTGLDNRWQFPNKIFELMQHQKKLF